MWATEKHNQSRKASEMGRHASVNDHDRAFFGRLCARKTAAGTFPTTHLPHSLERQTKTSIKTHAPENQEEMKYTRLSTVTVYTTHVYAVADTLPYYTSS